MKTDSQLQQDVMAELKRRATSDSKAMTVSVNGDEVTLGGSVKSWSERDLATRSAWSTSGVRHVVDQMNLVY